LAAIFLCGYEFSSITQALFAASLFFVLLRSSPEAGHEEEVGIMLGFHPLSQPRRARTGGENPARVSSSFLYYGRWYQLGYFGGSSLDKRKICSGICGIYGEAIGDIRGYRPRVSGIETEWRGGNRLGKV
jgi:hypothetical protein